MAVLRAQPYGNQNFVVDLGTGTSGPDSSFAEVIIPGISVDVIEYRSGSDPNNVRKLPGLTHYGDVTLKRGIVGSLNLYQWIDAIRNGATNAARNVTIQLLSEDRSAVVFTWKLFRAWPAKYVGPTLKAEGNDVALEELVLTYERLELE